MADQPTPTLPTASTALPPGMMSLEDALKGQASLSRQPQRASMGQMYEDYVASPLTQLVSKIAPASPFQNPMTFDPTYGTESVAKFAVPQNLTEVGIAAATMGAGGLAGKLGLTGLKAGATRIGGAMLGGAAGKVAGEEDVSAGTVARGAGQGLIAGVTGETIGAGVQFARKAGMERALAKRDVLDAAQVGQAVSGNPKLKGVFQNAPRTPEGLRDLALGTVPDPRNPGKVLNKGEAMVKQYLDQQDAMIVQQLQRQEQQMGRKYLFPDPLTPGKSLPYDEARHQLTRLGDMTKLKSAVVGDQTLYRGDLKQLYAETLRTWQHQLGLVDPQALRAFNDSRGVWEASTTTQDLLKKIFKKKTAGRQAMNTERLHDLLGDHQKELTNRLGIEGFESLARAVRLEGRMGQKDILNPTGVAANIAGVMPLAGGAYMRGHVGSPQLLGDPLNLSGGMRTGIDIGASQLLGRGLDVAPSPQQMLQGIPGLR